METVLTSLAVTLVVILAIWVAVVLSRHSPARLSEEEGRRSRGHGAGVVGRPAGPDAEATGVKRAGEPATSAIRDAEEVGEVGDGSDGSDRGDGAERRRPSVRSGASAQRPR